MTPATVRLKEDGRYELVSGHRRRKACELAGLETLKCEVKELTRDEAIIVMVESNLQRSTIFYCPIWELQDRFQACLLYTSLRRNLKHAMM